MANTWSRVLALLVFASASLLPVVGSGSGPSGGASSLLCAASCSGGGAGGHVYAADLPGLPLSEPEPERQARPDGPERDVLAGSARRDGSPSAPAPQASLLRPTLRTAASGRVSQRYKLLCTFRL